MREIITFHIGQTGTQISSPLWELLCLEHNISLSGELIKEKEKNIEKNDNIISYPYKFFDENLKGKLIPRVLFFDSEMDNFNKIKKNNLKDIFSPNSFNYYNNFPSGLFIENPFYRNSKNNEDEYDNIRKLIEKCDSLEGFFLIHSLGGGVGSSFSSALLRYLNLDYYKKMKFNISIFPSNESNSSIIEIYNSIFAINDLNHSDLNLILNNQCLYKICEKYLNINQPNYNDINLLIAYLISNITSSMRFNGTINSNINELCTNLVIYPNFNFILSSNPPFVTKEKEFLENFSIDRITNLSFYSDYQMSINNNQYNILNKYISINLMYKGDIILNEINIALKYFKERKKIKFYESIYSGFKYGINNQPIKILKNRNIGKILRNVCLLYNSTNIKEIFKDIKKEFDLIYSNKAFLHWYYAEGITSGSEIEAKFNIESIISDYNELNNSTL